MNCPAEGAVVTPNRFLSPLFIEGKGVFHIKVNDERNRMTGYCAYHDKDSGKIEGSAYEWNGVQ